MTDTASETPCQTDKVDGCVSSKAEKEDVKVANSGDGDKTPANHDKDSDENPEAEPELYFTPKVSLPLVDVKTMEDDEEVLVELRSRVYRFDTTEEDEPEFKERGTGVVKILRHKETERTRILLRRDKTHKICANHYITSSMELKKHNNSDKVFVYYTAADLYEGETNPETFAIRFSSPENATIFKNAFNDAVKEIKEKEKELKKKEEDEVNDLSQVLGEVNLEESSKKDDDKDDTK